TMHIASLKLLLSFLILSLAARPYIIVLSEEDLKESTISCDESPDWDEFVDFDSPHKSEDELDPGSWHSLFDPASSSATGSSDTSSELEALYISGVSKMISASSSGDARLMQEAAAEIEAAACEGHPHSRSVLGFLHGMGMMSERNKAKAFLYHHFAAEGGNMQSKMALAYSYSLQEMYENSTKLYAE
ncbi:hypothetical protein F2P56_034563, partial [Juglans regia]